VQKDGGVDKGSYSSHDPGVTHVNCVLWSWDRRAPSTPY
jgi:hypothetical protein